MDFTENRFSGKYTCQVLFVNSGMISEVVPKKYPLLTSISGISEPHQSELYHLPADLPLAKDGRKNILAPSISYLLFPCQCLNDLQHLGAVISQKILV